MPNKISIPSDARIISGSGDKWYDLPTNLRRLGSMGKFGGPLGMLSGAGSELGAQMLETMMGRRPPGGGEITPIATSAIGNLARLPIGGDMSSRLQDIIQGAGPLALTGFLNSGGDPRQMVNDSLQGYKDVYDTVKKKLRF